MSKFDPVKFREAMERAPMRLFNELRDAFAEYTLWFATNRMVRQARSALSVGSGSLARSFKELTSGSTIDTLRSLVYTDSPYAALQEHGGTVRPKAARALTIPMQAALAGGAGGAGVASSARSFGFSDTFVGKDAEGNAFIFRRLKGDEVEPLFRLVPEVTVPARLGFFRTWADDHDERESTFMGAVDRTLTSLGAA